MRLHERFVGRVEFDPHRRTPQSDLGTLRECYSGGDRPTVEEGAVVAAGVLDGPAAVCLPKEGVEPGDVGITVKADSAVPAPAQTDLSL